MASYQNCLPFKRRKYPNSFEVSDLETPLGRFSRGQSRKRLKRKLFLAPNAVALPAPIAAPVPSQSLYEAAALPNLGLATAFMRALNAGNQASIHNSKLMKMNTHAVK